MRKCNSPCPGCNKTGYWGLKGTLCMDCREALKVGNEVMDARKLAKNAPVGVFQIPWAYYAWPYFQHADGKKEYHFPGSENEPHRSEHDAKDMFSWHWHHLVLLLGEPCRDYNEGEVLVKNPSCDSHDKHEPHRMRKDIAGHLRALYRYIPEMVENSYADGYSDGENLLTRIATGDITMSELNTKSVKAGRR